MRLLPIALACYGQPPESMILSSRAQAHVTHNNDLSDAACETLILMVQDLLGGCEAIDVERERASKLVKQHPVFAYDKKRCDNPSGYIIDTLQAVFQSFFATENFEDCLTDIVCHWGQRHLVSQPTPPPLALAKPQIFPRLTPSYAEKG